ncbi:MAG: DUF1553 domain-containing protein [Acidobacteria bacterium]|nr:DUF1553 domain-containing protein [Acidobacteriota bacterium]
MAYRWVVVYVMAASLVWAQTAKAPGPQLTGLEVEPPMIRLDRPGATQQLLVIGKYGDGTLRDVTGQAQFTSSNPQIAAVSKTGRIAPSADGVFRVEAAVGTKRASAEVVVRNFGAPVKWSFINQITPILTYGGCNQSSCHGSPVGKNGFKLSLFGYHPEEDYAALVTQVPGRRVNTKEVDKSLALRKPTMTETHGGGPRFAKDSTEYKTLRAWIEAGAPYGDAETPVLAKLEVLPSYRVLQSMKEKQRLLVAAIYSDGAQEDVTGKAVYTSNDESILKVDRAGVAAPGGGNGDAAFMVRYGGQVAVAVLGATMLPKGKPEAYPTANNIVDREIYAKLKDLHIQPSGTATDEEFIRRIYLDVLGTLPAAADVRQFVASAAADKRAILIDQVLERPEYADLQALTWADRLRSDTRFHRVGGVRSYIRWLREEFATNRPLDKLAYALLTARGANYTVGPANYWGNYDKISTPVEVAIQTGQVLMGVRIGCAQCHNHPFEKWTQDDFYSLAAVFSQVAEFHTKNSQEFDLRLDPSRAVMHPLTHKAATPRYLGGEVIDVEPGADRRVKFAQWLTAKDNPFFPRAMANLIWRNLMGRGLVQPADDMRETNPPTHPALLDALAKELAEHHFDQKHLIRLITNSKTYQHSSRANASNKLDFKYYSRSYPKRMMAEVYMDAIAQVAGVPDSFNNWPEAKRATQLPDNRYNSYFLEVFDRSNRLVICDREEVVNTRQALHFVNGPELQAKLADPDGRLTQWLVSGKSDSALLEDMFLSSLSRKPRPDEKDRLLTRIASAPKKHEIFEDVLWALLSSREFVFNH